MKVVAVNPKKHDFDPKFYPKRGTTGKIVLLDTDDRTVKVKWEKNATEYPGIWWTSPKDIAAVESNKIIIYVDGENDRNVIAKDLYSGRTAVARCSPADEFNFYTGAELAMSRLREAARAPQADDIRPITGCKFKVGDVIIGNKKANKYGITKEKWVGKVIQVFDEPIDEGGCDRGAKIWFTAAPVNGTDSFDFPLDQDAFDRA